MKVKLLGCQLLRPRPLRPNGPALLPILITGGVVILLTAVVLFTFMCRKKRKTAGGTICAFTKGCPTVIKSQQCYQTQLRPPVCELIAYPENEELSRELCRQQLPDYAEPDISQVGSCGQKVPSTFKPSADDGYTVPLIVSHYDVPGKHHEYAEPLPPEAEYATPFGEQQVESTAAVRKVQSPRYPHIPEETTSQYDFVFHVTGLASGHTEAPLSLSTGYAEPQVKQTTELNNVTSTQECNGYAFSKETYSQPKDSLTHVYHELL